MKTFEMFLPEKPFLHRDASESFNRAYGNRTKIKYLKTTNNFEFSTLLYTENWEQNKTKQNKKLMLDKKNKQQQTNKKQKQKHQHPF